MGFPIYINTQASNKSQALFTDLTPEIPDLVIGDQLEVDIFFVNDAGQIESFSGDLSKDLKLAVGEVAASPTSGTFTLSYDGDTTNSISYDATSTQIETELNALASIISAGGVVVTGTTGGLRIVFNNDGARTAITGDGANLSPSSGVFNMVAEAGDATTKSIQLIRIRQTVIAFTETWTQITDSGNAIGYRGIIDTNTVAAALALGESETNNNLTLEVQTADSNVTTTWLQKGITLRNDMIDPATLQTLQLPAFVTSAEVASVYLAKDGSNGPMTGDLDFDGNQVANADRRSDGQLRELIGIDSAGKQTTNPAIIIISDDILSFAIWASNQGIGNNPFWNKIFEIDNKGKIELFDEQAKASTPTQVYHRDPGGALNLQARHLPELASVSSRASYGSVSTSDTRSSIASVASRASRASLGSLGTLGPYSSHASVGSVASSASAASIGSVDSSSSAASVASIASLTSEAGFTEWFT